MNIQGKLVTDPATGKQIITGNHIEWCTRKLPDGSVRRGYTLNISAGCMHDCKWLMPDGTLATCYADDVASGIANKAYPQGFAHYYWYPERLAQPEKVKQSSRIFVGSMTDQFGHWVPKEHIDAAIYMALAGAPQHEYVFLTKNPKRYQEFEFSSNCWLGMSTPPSEMWGKKLTLAQKERMLMVGIEIMGNLPMDQIAWLSAEPLSFDIVPNISKHPYVPFNWIVIGAASKGNKFYPPDEKHVRNLIEYCDDQGIKVFFKGNMRSLAWARNNWREDMPAPTVHRQFWK